MDKQLTSMKTSANELEQIGTDEYTPPEYPYGLELRLGSDELEKLGLGKLASGTELKLVAKVKVTRYAETEEETDGAGTETMRDVELQITDMALEAVREKKSLGDVLYPDQGEA